MTPDLPRDYPAIMPANASQLDNFAEVLGKWLRFSETVSRFLPALHLAHLFDL